MEAKRTLPCGAQPGRDARSSTLYVSLSMLSAMTNLCVTLWGLRGGHLTHLRETGQTPRKKGKLRLEPAIRLMKKGNQTNNTKENKTQKK